MRAKSDTQLLEVVLRCSSLPMYLACAHSQDEEPLQIEAYNAASDLGTAVHDAMRSIVKGLPVDVQVLALRHGVDAKDLGPLVAFGYKAWNGGEDQEPLRDAYPLPETEVTVEVQLERLRLTGHIDLLSVIGVQGRLLDWKSGRKESSDYYAQLLGYAVCLLLGRGLAEVVATVVWLRSQTVETYRFTRDEAYAFVDRLVTHRRNGRYRHGEHCGYCPRSHDCEALVAIARRDAAIFSEADVEQLVREAAPEALVDGRRRLKVIEAFSKSYEDALRRRIRAEGPLDAGDGKMLALVEENGKREIHAAKAWPVVQPLLEDMSEEQLNGVLTISAASLDEVVAKRAGKGKGAAAKRALRAELEVAEALTQGTVQKLKEIDKPLPELPVAEEGQRHGE